MRKNLRDALFTVVVGALAISGLSPVASADSHTLNVSVAKAPVAPDGTTAWAVADFVLTFADTDPEVPGVAMMSGGTIVVELAPDFMDAGGGGDLVIILQGWPQSPRVPFPYATQILGNTITLTLNDDWTAPSAAGPGPKQVHLGLLGWVNPGPGRYPVSMTIDPDGPLINVAEIHSGVATVKIIPRARPSVNVVSLFSGGGPPPPFNNPLYQTVSIGENPNEVGLYLWDRDSAPFVGVDLQMVNPTHGRLIQGGSTVGHVRIYAPRGAKDFAFNTLGPSTLVPAAFFTGVPVGLLLVQFQPDPDTTGDYAIEISMNNGNAQTLFVSVVE